MTAPFLTALRRIPTAKGDVLHGIKAVDPGFAGFGEAYFTQIEPGQTKGWKRHFAMTLNLICPHGSVRLGVHDGTTIIVDTILSPDRPDQYNRLTVPASFWVAFHGNASVTSLLLNVASLPHDPSEAETISLDHFTWLGG
jgi:dTDP-4-dehydrorhamnose 3,5-epimerase